MTPAEDMLKGAKKIAAYTGFEEREIYAFFKAGTLPLFRVGKHICGRKSEIDGRLSGSARR